MPQTPTYACRQADPKKNIGVPITPVGLRLCCRNTSPHLFISLIPTHFSGLSIKVSLKRKAFQSSPN